MQTLETKKRKIYTRKFNHCHVGVLKRVNRVSFRVISNDKARCGDKLRVRVDGVKDVDEGVDWGQSIFQLGGG